MSWSNENKSCMGNQSLYENFPNSDALVKSEKELYECNHFIDRGETRALIGGGLIFIYSCSARRISFEINLNDSWFQKKFVGQNKKIWILTPQLTL